MYIRLQQFFKHTDSPKEVKIFHRHHHIYTPLTIQIAGRNLLKIIISNYRLSIPRSDLQLNILKHLQPDIHSVRDNIILPLSFEILCLLLKYSKFIHFKNSKNIVCVD